MKKTQKILSILFLLVGLFVFVACNNQETPSDKPEWVDYVSQVTLEQSFTGKTMIKDGIEEVELYQAIDGDTIHVLNHDGAVLKLRFLGVDTPESTAAVEPWGAAASKFTKERVKNCSSLVITSDGGPGATDSYERYLSWVWYKPTGEDNYRLLNLELVQEGYSKSKNSGVKNYYDIFVQAATQARTSGIKVWGETDPDYCYTEAQEISLKALKEDLFANGQNSQYYLKKVVFTATIARISGTNYYLVDTDYETNVTYGIQVFYRASAASSGNMEVVGNRVKICGTVTYYETGNVYQLTDIIDKKLTSNKENLKFIEHVDIIPDEITAQTLSNTANKNLEYNFVKLNNIRVTSTYTTKTEGSSSYGAITITGDVNGTKVTVRTAVLIDKTSKYLVDNNGYVLAANFDNKTIDVTGIIEMYNGSYQIKLVSMDDVVFH